MSEWGYQTPTASIGTVTEASSTIVAANANRKYLYVGNTGGTPGYLGFGAAAVINQGVRIERAGSAGCFYEMAREMGNINNGSVTAILTATGTAQFCILEGT